MGDRKTAATAFVTGGIGAAMVAALAADGFSVMALGRDRSRLEALATRYAGVHPVQVDMADPTELAVPVPEQLDALIHCAGVADVASVAQSTPELWRRTLDINLISTAELTRRLLPALRAERGRVVFVNAAYGTSGIARWSAYVGSKAALTELADSLRQEEEALRVTSVYPAGVVPRYCGKCTRRSAKMTTNPARTCTRTAWRRWCCLS